MGTDFSVIEYRLHIGYILTIGKSPVELLFRTDNQAIEFTLTRSGRYQMAADNVLFHTFERIDFTVDSSLVEDFGRFLE